MPNFILAPVYGPTLGYWYLTGSLSKPSDDFPYGFSDPLPQLGFLILEHRLFFLVLGLAAFAYLGHCLAMVTDSPLARAPAMLFCVATNYPFIVSLPTARPDSPMLSFLAAALGVYLVIVYKGLTPARAFWLSIFAVLSISSKDILAAVFRARLSRAGVVGVGRQLRILLGRKGPILAVGGDRAFDGSGGLRPSRTSSMLPASGGRGCSSGWRVRESLPRCGRADEGRAGARTWRLT